MEYTVEKSCWNITFWAVAIAVVLAALVSLTSSVEVADGGDKVPSAVPASVSVADSASEG